MRFAGTAGLCCLFAAGLSVRADPPRVGIIVKDVEARSGPSEQFYATNKVTAGQTVQVLRTENGDWLAIPPPRDSFSWVKQRDVQEAGPRAVMVVTDGASALVGSVLVDREPNRSQLKLQRGAQLTVIGRARDAGDGEKYVPVQSPPGEVRYLPLDSVRFADAPAAPTGLQPPVETQLRPDPVRPAPVALSPPAANTPPANGVWQPVAQSAAPQTPPSSLGQMARSGQGRLYRTTLPAMDNLPVYGVISPQGQVQLYATAFGGVNLEPFVNRNVELFGPMVYMPQLRKYYMRVTQIVPQP
jgi:hypothetical protein